MTRPASIMGGSFALALLAACGRAEAPVPASAEGELPAEEPVSSPVASLESQASTGASSPLPTVSAKPPGGVVIPAALRGRWGLVPADFTSPRGDAKGLLVIGPDRLRFYESTARAGRVIEETSSRIRASFAFSGEGSVWTRELPLDLGDGGKTLIRRDYGGDAGPESLIYTRC